MNNIQKLISAVTLGDKEEMGKQFASIMQDKVRAAVDVKTIEVAEKIYNTEETITESAEVTISVDNVALTEALRAGKGKTTVDADYMGDRYFTNVSQRKFKIKIKPTGKSTADITGEKKDIIAFLKSDDYGMDDRDIKDLFPELLEAKSMIINRAVRIVDELETMLKKGSRLNKEVNKTLGGNYDRDFKEMQDSMDDIYDTWKDIEGEIGMMMSEEVEISEAKGRETNRAVRNIDELETMLKRGSKLNREVNKTLGGNYDRDFKEMQDSMDDIFDTWKDIEGEIDMMMMSEEVEISEAKIEVPTDEKAMKAFLDKAKSMRATEKDFQQSMKPLDLKQFAKFDKHARDHKDFKGAYEMGYDAGMGYDLPKGGGLEGNNPHKKNTFAYSLWMDIAGQGMSDA
jgi:hypothetical protein